MEDPHLLEMQPVWQRAADRVVADLRASTSLTIKIRIAISNHGPDLTWVWAGTPMESRASSWWTDTNPDRMERDQLWLESNLGCEELQDPYDGLEEATEHVARWVQDNVIEHEQITWPKCPEHFHPLTPTATAIDAFWVCDRDPRVRIAIGSYLPA